MVTPYALFRRWIQKADRTREHKDGLSCFEPKKSNIFFKIIHNVRFRNFSPY